MIVEHEIDCGRCYRIERHHLLAVLAPLEPERLDTTVPATPAWTVRDVLAHVVGITTDLNSLDLDELGIRAADPEAWTAAQVAERRGRSLAELAAEWEREADRFEEGLRLLGYELGSHYVGDLLQHVIDVQAAVGVEQAVDAGALTAGLDHYLDALHRRLDEAGLAVEVRLPREAVVAGRGAPGATLTVEPFEAFRALGGRRSRRQLTELAWDGDADAVLDLLGAYPMPAADLDDGTMPDIDDEPPA